MSNTDKHIGARLRYARREHRMSQTELGERIGVTFQQVQKYEKGTNRISAARLYQSAHVLDRPITYFFEGLGRDDPTSVEAIKRTRDNAILLQAFDKLPGDIQRRFVELVTSVARHEPDLSEFDDLEEGTAHVQ